MTLSSNSCTIGFMLNDAIKFIALDMDGTILNDKYEISPKVVAALSLCRQHGKKVIISTGRVFASVRKHIDPIGGVDGYVCSNGADVYEGDGTPILQNHLDAELSRKLYKMARSFDSHFHAFLGDDWYYETERPYTGFYFKRSGLAGGKTDFDEYDSPRFTKCMFLDDHDKLEPIRLDLEKELGSSVQIMYSAPFMLEIVARGVSKSSGLEACVGSWGGLLGEVIAFGDADNDEDMLVASGVGVAMGNAHEGLKAKADFIAPTVDESGVAVFLNEFFGLGLP